MPTTRLRAKNITLSLFYCPCPTVLLSMYRCFVVHVSFTRNILIDTFSLVINLNLAK